MKKWLSVSGLLVSVLLLAPLAVQAETITRLTFSGPAGEYISQGRSYAYTPADGTFLVTHDSHNGVTVQFSTPTRPWLWTLQFGGPNATAPEVGVYEDCRRYGFNDEYPGVALWGDGRGCNELRGMFEVKEIVYSEFDVASVWVTFTLYCDSQMNPPPGEQAKPVSGEFIYNVDAATPTRTTSWGSLKTMYR